MLSDFECVALDRRLLAECVKGLSAAKRRAIFKPYQEGREFYAHTSSPGHEFWYPIKVQEEARAAEVLGFPVPPYVRHLASLDTAQAT